MSAHVVIASAVRPSLMRGRLPLLVTAGLLGPTLLLLLSFFLIPLVQMVDVSLREESFGQILPGYTLGNYAELIERRIYTEIFLYTIASAFSVVVFCAVLGYPVAMHMASVHARWRPLLYFLVAAPLLINTVVRTYGWLLLLGRQGVFNSVLAALGVTDQPLALSGNYLGMIIGATQVFLPFMILTLAASLQGVDRRLLESADVLGASPWRRFWTVTFPLTMPGLIGGSVLVFSLMLGAFVTPLILGGTAIRYLSVAVYTDALVLFNLPRATALGIVLLVMVLAIYAVQRRLVRTYKERL
jgi:putative spermidine/putrescine transport system permease protein